MGFVVGNIKNPSDAKKAAIEALKAKVPKAEDAVITKYIPPAECSDRIRIEFDDSGSMSGEIENAKRGVVEFLKNCIPNQTAVAVHFMNTTEWSTSLRSDLPQLSMDIQEFYLSSGGTPFFNTMKKMLEATPRCTRIVAFTDGSPTDNLAAEGNSELQEIWTHDSWIASADIIIKITKAVKPEIPIDTVFFGSDYSQREMNLLKYLSDKTGGFFLHFDPKKMNFATAFKYLAPVYRLQLSDGNFRAAVERGERK